MELENKLKSVSEENKKLAYENKTLMSGIQTVNPTEEVNVGDLSDPNSIAEELRQMKRKNESLKRENDIIRRELSSLKDRDFNGKGIF
jgi:cell division protein FtsB